MSQVLYQQDNSIKFQCLYPGSDGVQVTKNYEIHMLEIRGEIGKICLSGRTNEEYTVGELFLLSCIYGCKS